MDAGVDHKTLIASLPEADRRRLIEKSDGPGLRHGAIHFGLIALLGYAIAIEVPYWWALILPQGMLIMFLFTLLHEASHLTPFRTATLNRVVAWLSGFLILILPVWFRYFHFAHHRYTQDPARDPELATPKPTTLRQYVWHVSGIPVWVGNVRQLIDSLLYGSPGSFAPRSAHRSIRIEAMLFVVGYAGLANVSVAFDNDVLLWAWIVPALVGQPFLRLYLLAEHGLLPETPNMLENSRTVRSNAVVRWLAWNMPYHIEHHTWPMVPFHRLGDLHALIHEDTRTPTPGYIAFHHNYIARLVRSSISPSVIS